MKLATDPLHIGGLQLIFPFVYQALMTKAQKELDSDHTNVFAKLRKGSFPKAKSGDWKIPKIGYVLNSYL